MRYEVLFAGFGGQGIIKSALLFSEAAGVYNNYEIAQSQSYGPEARGGACKSEVVLSDSYIDYIKVMNVNAFMVMSQPAFDKYVSRINPESTIVVPDTTLIENIRGDYKYCYPVEATRIAEEELGRTLFANIIMLGALSALTQIISLEDLEKSLVGNVPEKTLDLNKQALRRGHELASLYVK